MEIAAYPLLFLLFWYKDGIKGVFHLISEVNSYFLQLLSVPLMLRTFFRPIKNEYRGDLVVFSIVMGIVVKSFLLILSLIIFLLLLVIEITGIVAYIMLPLLPIYLLIK